MRAFAKQEEIELDRCCSSDGAILRIVAWQRDSELEFVVEFEELFDYFNGWEVFADVEQKGSC
mgnify:FL=1